MAEAQGGGVAGKCKKRSRNADKCKRYFSSGRREKNKARRLKKHLARLPKDQIAIAALKKIEKALPGTRFKKLS